MRPMSLASKLLPALLACALYAWCALLASVPASAQILAPDCLTVLDACQICVQRNGQVDIRACGNQPPTTDLGDDIPAELLQEPRTDNLDGLQKVIAERILLYWRVLYPVFGDPNRIYLPRNAFVLASKYQAATANEILQAAIVQFQGSLISKASQARIARFPTGDGGERYTIRSTDPLLSFVINLLTDAGAFADVDLSSLDVAAKRGISPDITSREDVRLFRLFRRSLRPGGA